ncbi:MAG TPA: glycosyltransferase [Solirubrobacteraceae bacterium]|jgi:glycosyltransferase involved in cell wall biosynthesis|nr:glycosyltransferase [Solirubrobacteraceae bacterium]
MSPPQITVVIPAFNEQDALPSTLKDLQAATRAYAQAGAGEAEVIVVDNASTDQTATLARDLGARVVHEPRQGIAFARNAGAAAAAAPWLFFLDADTSVPPEVLIAIDRALSDPRCLGGAPATRYHYRKRALWPYMQMWKLVARLRHMTQGVGQFVTAWAFATLGGYPTDLRMAEDTEFNWQLRKLASRRGDYTAYLGDTVIVPSSRRLDEWPIWRTILMTNPITTRMFLRSSWFWKAWRDDAVR